LLTPKFVLCCSWSFFSSSKPCIVFRGVYIVGAAAEHRERQGFQATSMWIYKVVVLRRYCSECLLTFSSPVHCAVILLVRSEKMMMYPLLVQAEGGQGRWCRCCWRAESFRVEALRAHPAIALCFARANGFNMGGFAKACRCPA
jgi:hypothetical protein